MEENNTYYILPVALNGYGYYIQLNRAKRGPIKQRRLVGPILICYVKY